MKALNNNIPKLRFNEFSKPWDEKKLGDIAGITKLAGYEFTKHVVYSNHGKIIALRALNIKSNSLVLDKVKYIDKSQLSMLKRSKLYIGDILFTYVGTIGELAVISENDKYYLAPNVARVRLSKQYLPYFVSQSFQIPRVKIKEIFKYINSSSQPALSMGNIRKFIFFLPDVFEQQKIADFLSSVDARISQLTKKKLLLVKYKKGIMQKIFKQEIRFKDDNGNDFSDWQEKMLGEISEPVKRKTDKVISKIMTISAGKGFLNQEDRFSQVIAGTSLKNYTLLYKDELAYNRGNSKSYTYGCIYKLKEEMALIPYVYRSFKLNNGNSAFYEQLFICKYLDCQLRRMISSSARMDGLLNITEKAFYSVKVPQPCLHEQKKIAGFLGAIDRKIDLASTELGKAQEFKKGLLQQMFV